MNFFNLEFKWNTLLTILSLVVSANIAFFLYNYFNWSEGYWSVVSIAAVVTADLSNTFAKMISRLLGTFVGAAYAYLAVHFFGQHISILILLLISGLFFSSIASLQKNMLSYAGIISNITIILIIATSIDSGNFFQVAVNRTYQVCLGIIILWIVDTLLYKKMFLESETKFQLLFSRVKQIWHNLKTIVIRKSIIVVAIKILLATAVTFVPWLYFRYPGGFWATISCFFILEETLAKTQQKALLRFLAHVFAASFGLIAVLLIGNYSWLLCIPLTFGFAICGYILSQGKQYSSIGNTIGIALGVMLLADPGLHSSLEVIFARFINVIFGVGVGILISSLPILRTDITRG